jgi:hypothetical protein
MISGLMNPISELNTSMNPPINTSINPISALNTSINTSMNPISALNTSMNPQMNPISEFNTSMNPISGMITRINPPISSIKPQMSGIQSYGSLQTPYVEPLLNKGITDSFSYPETEISAKFKKISEMDPRDTMYNSDEKLMDEVIYKLVDNFIETPLNQINSLTSSNSSNSSNNSNTSNNRFFRDVGKKNKNTNQSNPTNKNESKSGLSYKELKEISKNNWRALIETGIIGSLFGSTVAYIIYYINFAISISFKLFILFIIFNICVIIYKAIQMSLDVSHKVMGGVKSSISGINNLLNQIGINFVVPGISIPAIRFRTGDLFKLNWYPFKNSLGGPLNKIDSAVRAIPRDATDVIIAMIREMLVGLIDNLPKMMEGMIKMFEKIMK